MTGARMNWLEIHDKSVGRVARTIKQAGPVCAQCMVQTERTQQNPTADREGRRVTGMQVRGMRGKLAKKVIEERRLEVEVLVSP